MRSACWLLLACAASAARAQEPDDAVAFTVEGRALDRQGQPRAGLRVEAWDRMAPERYLAQAVSGPKGRYRLALRASAVARREHPYAPVLLIVRGAGVAEARLEAPAGARGVDVRTEAASVIRGVVRDRANQPVPAAVVRAYAAGAERPRSPLDVLEETTTDEGGRFALRRFAAPQVLVEVDADGSLAVATVRAGRDNEIRVPEVQPVRGRLVDAEAGLPVAGARLLRRGRPLGETDADGRFSFPEPLGTAQEAVGVSFWKEGYDATPLQVAVAGTRDYRLRRVAPLRGRVVDERERPVAGVRVVIEGTGLACWSDADGAFELAFLPLGVGRLRAARAGYVEAAVRMELGLAPDTVTLQLWRGARVGGRVLRDGEPALGVRVGVHDETREIACAFTDAEGRFLFRGVPVQGRAIVASEARRRSMHRALEGLAEGAQVGPLTLEVKEHLPLRGVLRSDAGHPLAGAVVRCGGRQVATDVQGRFLFEGLPVQRYAVRAEAPRHRPVAARSHPGRSLDLTAASRFGERAIEVGVTGDGTGEVRVTLERRAVPRVRRSRVTRLGSEPVRFEELPAGTYDLNAQAEGHLPWTRVVEVGAADVRVEAGLERGGSVRLAATPGAAVAIQAVRGKPPPVVALRLAEGTRELRGFGPGLYRFLSRAPGELIVVEEVELGPSTPPVQLDLRGGRESTLEVQVRDLAGHAMEGAEIVLVTEGGFEHNTRRRTGADGRVVLERLFGGRLHVRAQRGPRVGEAAVEVTPGAALRVAVTVR